MKKEAKRKTEKIQDKLEPGKAPLRNLSRIVDRLDETNDRMDRNAQLQEKLIGIIESKSSTRVENFGDFNFPKSFRVENLDDFPVSKFELPETVETSIPEKPEWYENPPQFPEEIHTLVDWENMPRENIGRIFESFKETLVSSFEKLGSVLSLKYSDKDNTKPQLVVVLDGETGKPMRKGDFRPLVNVEQRIPPSGTGGQGTSGSADVTDRASRLLGIIYGNLAQIQQKPSTFELLTYDNNLASVFGTVPLLNAGRLKVESAQAGAWSVGVNNFPSSYDISDRSARLLGIIYGNLTQLQQKASTFELLTYDNNLASVFGTTSLVNAARLKTTSADGDHVSLGSTADAEATGNGSLIAIAKRLRTLLAGGLPAALVNGRLDVNVGATAEPATYTVVADRVAPAANKFVLTLFNTSSTRKVVIQKVLIYNWQTATVSGVLLEFEVKRITARTVGTTVASFAHDSNDSLSAGISADTNSSAVTEGVLIRRAFSASEEIKIGALTLENSASVDDNFATVIEKKDGNKGHVLRQNQGITIKQITSSTVGNVSAVIIFTDESA